MRVVFMGTPDFAVGSLEALIREGYEITGVVTQPDKPAGRKKKILPGPVKAKAVEENIPVYQPERIRNEEAIEEIRRMDPEMIVVAAFGQIIPKEILDLPKYGCINVHASLLPKLRGASPIQHAILEGESKTGVTIMKMNEGLDTGDMISVAETEIRKEDTGGSLFDRLALLGAELLVQTIPAIVSGEATYTPQDEASSTYARMIRKDDGKIQWNEEAEVIERKIRALNPWPSAYTTLDGKTLKIWKAHIEKADVTGTSDEVGKIVRQDKKGMYIMTGKGILVPDEVQIAGKKRMSAVEFLRGYVIRNNTLQ